MNIRSNVFPYSETMAMQYYGVEGTVSANTDEQSMTSVIHVHTCSY